jgi:hypothetical protein
MPITERQRRLYDDLRRRVAHEQQHDIIAAAHRKVDNLRAQLDAACSVPWPTARQAARRGALDAALRRAEDELREIEAVIAMDRAMEPIYGPAFYERPSYSPHPSWRI